MNNDSDNIRNLLLWLLREFDPTFSPPSGNGSTLEANSTKASLFEVGSDATSMKPANQKGSEEASSYLSTFSSASLTGALQPRFSTASRNASSKDVWSQTAQSFNFGEIHAVQERFQALLKQRLLSEYESRPPLFPWESEVSEYPAEVADGLPAAAISPLDSSTLWNAHMGALKVPGLLPAALMNTLLERCQKIARSPFKQGVRLVRAVEDLFPESSDMLEPIADMVLVPAYRSGQATQDAVVQQLASAAGGYDSALPEQQIALSMLAAQEILGALTFSVSADNPCLQRSWITTVGALELTVTYEASTPESSASKSSVLKVMALLPDGGEVRLCDGEVEKLAVRSQPGTLDLTLAEPAIGKTYVMEVSLQAEEHSLNFAIYVDEAPSLAAPSANRISIDQD